MRRAKISVIMLVALAGLWTSSTARADSIFSFSVVSTGPQSVDVYLNESVSSGSSIIFNEGGLFSAGVRIQAVPVLPANPVIISTITPDPAFDFFGTFPNSPSDKDLDLAISSNPPVYGTITSAGGSVRLGSFQFSGGNVGEFTTFKATVTGLQSTFTMLGTDTIENLYGITDSAPFNIEGVNPAIVAAVPIPTSVASGGLLLAIFAFARRSLRGQRLVEPA